MKCRALFYHSFNNFHFDRLYNSVLQIINSKNVSKEE